MADRAGPKPWGRWIFYTVMVVLAVAPWPYIAWGRATRSASAPAVLEEVFEHRNGRYTVGAYSFSVDGRSYRDEDAGPTAGRGERTWSREDLDRLHVCYDPERPGEDFALTPPHYRCGDANIFTSDGGW
jgi:hypothetical protein